MALAVLTVFHSVCVVMKFIPCKLVVIESFLIVLWLSFYCIELEKISERSRFPGIPSLYLLEEQIHPKACAKHDNLQNSFFFFFNAP